MFDPKCYELAEYFLRPTASEEIKRSLAQSFQDIVADAQLAAAFDRRELALSGGASGDQLIPRVLQHSVDCTRTFAAGDTFLVTDLEQEWHVTVGGSYTSARFRQVPYGTNAAAVRAYREKYGLPPLPEDGPAPPAAA